MLTDLDHESSLDPSIAGSKSAQLAFARRSGLPVLPGFVVTAPTSRPHMRLGAETLADRGSGGARLVVSGHPIEDAEDLIAEGERLAPELVARSSTLLESSGEWAGAFTSYVDLAPGDLPKAVAGCWASAFSPDALKRQEAAGVEPGSFDMAVLVQPSLHPVWGGTAEVRIDGTAVIHAVEGSPAPLLQGWKPGSSATRSPGDSWDGLLVDKLRPALLDEIAGALQEARTVLGANRCEWAVDGHQLWLLQLAKVPETSRQPESLPNIGGSPDVWRLVVRSLVAAPGALGADLVLPWAIASGVPDASASEDTGPEDVDAALRLSRDLTGRVWGLSAADAAKAARRCLDTLLGPQPEQALGLIEGLAEPDPGMAGELMSLVHSLRHSAAARGAVAHPDTAWHLSAGRLRAAMEGEPVERSRFGPGRWEPLMAAIVLAHGRRMKGAAASPGLGAGLVHTVDTGRSPTTPPQRSILHSGQAAPVLSQLLWDASGVVTHGGSPAAHLFEAARSLGVPAVTGVDLDPTEQMVVAVDGFAGVVATISFED